MIMGMTIDDSERYLRLMLGGMKYAVRYWKDRDKEESDIEQTNVEAVKTALDTMRKYQQLEDFARWVATEVIDEEMWTYNHLAFAELACRKLVQLKIMQESDGEYTYEVVENGL